VAHQEEGKNPHIQQERHVYDLQGTNVSEGQHRPLQLRPGLAEERSQGVVLAEAHHDGGDDPCSGVDDGCDQDECCIGDHECCGVIWDVEHLDVDRGHQPFR
jgi:hypothetical protein